MNGIEADVTALVAAMAPGGCEPRLGDDIFIDLGYTSLRFLELSIAVERAFDLPPLTPETLTGVRTVGDLIDVVRAHRDRL